ncbi:hypothetical protein WMY93_007497 [Mugilogobius chulae]|uniref:Mediator of RNA polymerase II transcription subunit 31 n=1 Tax=Mugilogobius chulae TaxID=88201 RepID=A0AAW0PG88_9GOBI
METEEQARNRFQAELEFIQCLANPNYLNFLAQRGFLRERPFINYLKYLLTGKNRTTPSSSNILTISYCLHMLESCCHRICPFPHFHCQVQFCLSVLEGAVTLPSSHQMALECDSWLKRRLERGVPQRHLLRLEQEQWDYCRTLASDANFSPICDAIRKLYNEVWRQRRQHPLDYRRRNYRLLSDTSGNQRLLRPRRRNYSDTSASYSPGV